MVLTFGKFILRLAVFSVLLLLVYTISQRFFPSAFNYAFTHVLIAWYFLLTAAVHYAITVSVGHNEKRFVRTFMTTITLRFMLHLSIIFFWAFTHQETAVAFIISYFVLYLCFTLFEIIMLMNVIKSNTPERKSRQF